MKLQEQSRASNRARGVVVLHDLSAQAAHAAWRAGMIARDQRTPLCLLHASAAAGQAAQARAALKPLAEELRAHLRIEVELRVLQGETPDAVVHAGRDAGLLVLPAQRRNVLREWMFGTQAERLIRLCGRPVLVVKRPATAGYRRVLVPVDFGPADASFIAAATHLSRASHVEVFHSLATRNEVTLRASDVPEAQVRSYRRRRLEQVRAAIGELIDLVPGARASAIPCVGFGHASSTVLAREQAMRADLVVIGKRRRGLLGDFLLGSVTQRVLAAARSDVLVVPVMRRPHASLEARDQFVAA
jgi:nucleotide-binding universal stress UspA family protein